MSIIPINSNIKAEDVTKIIGFIKNIQASLPFLQNLNSDEIKSLRKMASRNTPYAQETLIALKTNPAILPATINNTEFVNKFQQDLNLHSQLKDIIAPLEVLLESIKDTQKIIGSQVMEKADLSYRYLKQSAKNDQSLGSVITKIAEFNKKFPKSSSKN